MYLKVSNEYVYFILCVGLCIIVLASISLFMDIIFLVCFNHLSIIFINNMKYFYNIILLTSVINKPMVIMVIFPQITRIT